MHATFEDVSRLTEDQLIDLLATGDQAERVWAAWALGLRLAGESRGDLSERLDGEPTCGVRQHLAVVLAGLGSVERLAAIAITDPSVEVRATAAQLCTRLLGPDTDAADTARRLCARLEREETTAVAAAILAEVRTDGPESLRALVDQSIRSERLALRRAAATAALRWEPARLHPDLREPALLEPDDELAAELLGRWCEREGAGVVLAELEAHEPHVAARTIRRLGELASLRFSSLAPFAARDHRELTEAVLDSVSELDPDGWRWLLSLVERNDADSRRLDVLDDPIRNRAIARLRELSPNPAGASLSYVDRPFLEAAERLVEQAKSSSQALVPRSNSVWSGLRIRASSGTWFELARRVYPDIESAELVCHECGDADLHVVSYRAGATAYLLIYAEADSAVEVDLEQFRYCAGDREILEQRESDL